MNSDSSQEIEDLERLEAALEALKSIIALVKEANMKLKASNYTATAGESSEIDRWMRILYEHLPALTPHIKGVWADEQFSPARALKNLEYCLSSAEPQKITPPPLEWAAATQHEKVELSPLDGINLAESESMAHLFRSQASEGRSVLPQDKVAQFALLIRELSDGLEQYALAVAWHKHLNHLILRAYKQQFSKRRRLSYRGPAGAGRPNSPHSVSASCILNTKI